MSSFWRIFRATAQKVEQHVCVALCLGQWLIRPGSVVPVAPGRMRNIFYPRKSAAYVTQENLRDLKKREVVMERDFTFGVKNLEDKGSSDDQDAIEMPSQPRSVNIQMDLLSVRRSIDQV